ncbi:hypothetical protein EV702DRAFT_1048813 [Suillus placidus]|uniref:Uncharacterized protein n=1 Tax=Suillus placidus TaxID=48579 RepID=A0A9P6ZMW5_9AGAM|nr:hypothetical protein EV702DRAFT_1048813 [Suillus placidus]
MTAQVVWWRGCKFPSSLGSPPSDVEQGDLVDELWQDQAKRREIRLGEWAHSWDTPREEDLIQNFMSAQASKELDDILRPHIASLQKLLDSPDLNQCDGVGAYSIPFCGDISTHEYAKIARWFSENIPGASGQVEKWLGGMPLVHAFTLVVAHRKAGDFKKWVQARNEEWNNSELLKMAWADLMISYPADSFVADVDLECLTTLEARMFEDSEEAWTCRQPAVGFGCWPTSQAVECRGPSFSDNSDATSSDELAELVAPSLPDEEEIVPLKRRTSLPTEECAPVKRRRASQRVQRGKTRK